MEKYITQHDREHGEGAAAPRTVTLSVKAVPDQDRYDVSIVSYVTLYEDGTSQRDCKSVDLGVEPAILKVITECSEGVPAGSLIRLVTQPENAGKAWHPDYNWLAKWVARGFAKLKNPEAWRRIECCLRDRRITVITVTPQTEAEVAVSCIELPALIRANKIARKHGHSL